jgi:hypothetical protein
LLSRFAGQNSVTGLNMKYTSFLLPVLLISFNSCSLNRNTRISNRLKTTDFSFYNGNIYVYEGLLSENMIRKIKKGTYVEIKILDSLQLSDKIVLMEDIKFKKISGKYVQIIKLSTKDTTLKKLHLSGEILRAESIHN